MRTAIRSLLVFTAILIAGGAQPPSVESAALSSSVAVPASVAVPVLLVPGWGDDAAHIAPFRRHLLEAGWSPEQVTAITFQNPVGSNEANAVEVASAVEGVLRRTGSDRVDVVAHSMGGLAVREYLRTHEGDPGVRRLVFLGTPHRGTVAALFAWGEGGREMVPGSSFLERLNGEGKLPDGVEVLAIRTPLDASVIPGSSAMLPGAYNLEVCCPTHYGLIHDERAFEEVRRFLEHGPSELEDRDRTIPLRTEAGLLPQGARPR